MTTEKGTKINRLLREHPNCKVFLSSWLKTQGMSLDLQKDYRKNGWLEAIDRGVMVRKGATIDWQDVVVALQEQTGLDVYPGGRTALTLHGKAHYIPMGKEQVHLFTPTGTKLPKWFLGYDWGVDVHIFSNNFLPVELGRTKHKELSISNNARAIMECLSLAPQKFDLVECYQLMEGLTTLPPTEVQSLLEACTSIKVNRLFLYMAEKAEHAWAEYLELSKINLGQGKRQLVADGVYIPKYQITIPKELYKA